MHKEKGDPLVCGSYRAIKLLEQPMKVHECVGNDGQVSIDNMQFNIKQSRRSCTMLLWI